MSQSRFVHLHLHSEYSLLDGACRLNSLFDRVKELGMDAVALTDHGNLFGAFDFYKEAKARGVKPLIGCELYAAPGSRFEKRGTEAASNQHLLLLAESVEGYYSLVKLSSLAYDEGFYYKPRIDLELLEKYKKGLVGLSGCLKGPVAERLLEGDERGALRAVDACAQILGRGNYYLEIMDHGMPEQRKVNEGILRLAQKTGLPVVATNDCHYLKREDAEIHDILLCISTGKGLEEENRLRFSSDQLYLKSPEEMIELFGHVPGAIENTVALADRLNPSIPVNQKLYPVFVPPEGKTDKQYLRELSEAGLKSRFPKGLPDERVYRPRVEYELETIEKTGFTSYYLVVWDFINYARKQGIPVGLRGSGAASLVAYAVGITDLDPIRHSLVFERFLNPERVDPPDFDIDFCYERRGEVIEYVKKKYGEKNVAQIVTFGTLKARNAVRDVGRVMGMTPSEVDRIAKLIPETLGITLDQALQHVADLKRLYENDSRVRRLIDFARRLEGTVRHSSTHAAGVVIADQELSDLAPTYRISGQGGQQEIATQYAWKQVIALGLLKMDFLGLKNLTIIGRCMRTVRETRGIEIDWSQIPDNDPQTYAMLQEGQAFGVFQLESSGMRDLLRRLKPESIAEITALIALYRPGPMQNIEEFIDRKHGRIQATYDHPLLEPILKETYGLIIYQEQVQQIANVLAGFSLGQGDVLRRAMGKKIKEEMDCQREIFIEGAVARGVERQTAEKIFALMAKFAEYGFNKGHSASYAVVSFRTAYLKAHYPVEYMAALLTNEIGANNGKLGLYISKAKEMGLAVLPPDINESNAEFTPVGEAIRFGLAAIKNVGAGVVDCIVEERKRNGPYTSLQNFCERVSHKALNSRMLECLIRAGAMDSLSVTRPQLLAIATDCLEVANQTKRERAGGQGSLFDMLEGETAKGLTEIPLPDVPDWSDKERLQNERELLGFFVSGHPLQGYAADVRSFSTMTSSTLRAAPDQAEAAMIGVITRIQTKADRSGSMMAFVELDDLEGSFEVLFFSRVYENCREKAVDGAVLWVKGRVSETNGERKLLAEEVEWAEDLRRKRARFVDLALPISQIDEEHLDRLRRAVKRHRGRCPLRLRIEAGEDLGEIVIETDKQYRINPSSAFVQDLERLGVEKALTYSAN